MLIAVRLLILNYVTSSSTASPAFLLLSDNVSVYYFYTDEVTVQERTTQQMVREQNKLVNQAVTGIPSVLHCTGWGEGGRKYISLCNSLSHNAYTLKLQHFCVFPLVLMV